MNEKKGGVHVTEFEKVYRAYYKDVELYLRAICRDESLAEELTAQTFFKTMHALPKFRGDCDIRTWLFTIARNCYFSHLRKTKQTESLENIKELQVPDTQKTLEEHVIDKQQALMIHEILQNMPPTYKEVFSLRVFGQLSFEEIGTVFHKSANWACVTYHRTKQKIRNEIEQKEG